MNVFRHIRLKYLSTADFIQNLREMPSCLGRGGGTCPVKIMILEVRFLLASFYSTSAIFNFVFGMNKIKYYSEKCRGEGDIPGYGSLLKSNQEGYTVGLFFSRIIVFG